MDEIFKAFPSSPTPHPPKFNVALRCFSSNGPNHQPPKVPFANTGVFLARWNIDFWGLGVQQRACCRVWIFCPSTVVQMGVSAMWLYCFPLKRSLITGFWGTQISNTPDTESKTGHDPTEGRLSAHIASNQAGSGPQMWHCFFIKWKATPNMIKCCTYNI